MTDARDHQPHPCPPASSRVQAKRAGEWRRPSSSSPSLFWKAITGKGLAQGCAVALVAILSLATPAQAIDPLYQRQMERLSEIMGSLYYLQPLCNAGNEDWRAQMSELISLDEPDEDRRQRLAGAFNGGYTAFSRFHRQCTPASRTALARLMDEAQKLARDIHTRFAE